MREIWNNVLEWRFDVLKYIEFRDIVFPIIVIMWIVGKFQEGKRKGKMY